MFRFLLDVIDELNQLFGLPSAVHELEQLVRLFGDGSSGL